MKKQIGKLTIPPTIFIDVYIGMYFNHYNAVVIFSDKPKFSEEKDEYQDKWIDLLDEYNRDIIIGCMYLGDFKLLYPNIDLSFLLNEHGNSNTLEPCGLIQAKLECILDDDNKMFSLMFGLDGYVK